MNYPEIYEQIQEMKTRFDEKGYATKIFHRTEYHEILCLLSNEIGLAKEKSVHVKVNIQDGIVTVSLRRKKP